MATREFKPGKRRLRVEDYEHSGDTEGAVDQLTRAGIKVVGYGDGEDDDGDAYGWVEVEVATREELDRALGCM